MRLARGAVVVAGLAAVVALAAPVSRVMGDDAATMDLDVTDKDVVDVVAQIAKASGKQIVVEKGVHDRITLQLNRVKWEEALELVAKRANCRIERGDAVTILKRAGVAPVNQQPGGGKTPFREYPIGDEVERDKEHVKVAAVWLPPVTMDHEHHAAAPGPYTIHLECDIHATKGNENGFGVGDWIPYMKVEYEITKEGDEKPALSGDFMPMVAKDGPHYGATIAMPGPGRYKLKYKLHPPSTNGLGRHTDPVTGVAVWWAPFEATYSWDYKGIPAEKEKR
jgi:periplasmic iron binding protein